MTTTQREIAVSFNRKELDDLCHALLTHSEQAEAALGRRIYDSANAAEIACAYARVAAIRRLRDRIVEIEFEHRAELLLAEKIDADLRVNEESGE